jgi:hypothetical protein
LSASARVSRENNEKKYNDGQPPPIKEPLRELTEQSIKSTRVIGDDFMRERSVVYNAFLSKEKLYARLSNLVFSCVIMTMDMEYAHVDGYYGIKIYNALFNSMEDLNNLKPCDYWTPVHGRWEVILGQRVFSNKKSRGPDQYTRTDKEGNPRYSNMKADYAELEKKASEEVALYGSYYDNKKKKTLQRKVHAIPVLTSKEETETYEQWEKQLKDTELAILKYPLKLLPMFHYDPRRYQPEGNKNGNVFPLTQVTGKGLYLGFKMYTAQGYRPWEPRLPILEDFYFRCCEGDIPILNHGTPGGAATFEKEEYFNFEHPNDTDIDWKQKAPQPRKLGSSSTTYVPAYVPGQKEKYFDEHFVSPGAWKKVLDKKVDGKPLNTLRLCLAHFGGPTKLGMKWSCQLIEMIRKGHYPNLYVDISSSFASSDFRNYFQAMITNNPEIEDHILFGTDWYLTLQYKLTYGKSYLQYCRETKRFLDTFNTSLWAKFTQYNPCRFYKLDTQIDRIAKNIVWKRQNDKETQKSLKVLSKKQINEIKKEAAYIKIPKQSYEIWEETPWRV